MFTSISNYPSAHIHVCIVGDIHVIEENKQKRQTLKKTRVTLVFDAT